MRGPPASSALQIRFRNSNYYRWCSALEQQDGEVARVVHEQGSVRLPGHLEGVTLTYDAVPRWTELLVHLFFD